MKARTAGLLSGLAAIFVAAAFAVPVAINTMTVQPALKTPTDDDMIAHWQKYRPVLDQMTEMLRSDPALNRLGLDWSDPEDPERAHVPASRIADYRDLMRESAILGISRGHRSVQFLFHRTDGIAPGGFRKSFVRGESSKHAEVIEGDLDAAAASRAKALLQRPIAEGWWLQRDGS